MIIVETPPIIVAPKKPTRRKRSLAFTLNFFLPGLGHLYYGQRRLGAILILIFLFSFGWSVTHYLSVMGKTLDMGFSGDLLKGDNLEQIESSYHDGTAGWALTISFVTFCTSLVTLEKEK